MPRKHDLKGKGYSTLVAFGRARYAYQQGKHYVIAGDTKHECASITEAYTLRDKLLTISRAKRKPKRKTTWTCDRCGGEIAEALVQAHAEQIGDPKAIPAFCGECEQHLEEQR